LKSRGWARGCDRVAVRVKSDPLDAATPGKAMTPVAPPDPLLSLVVEPTNRPKRLIGH
jgi:hypothetical protein